MEIGPFFSIRFDISSFRVILALFVSLYPVQLNSVTTRTTQAAHEVGRWRGVIRFVCVTLELIAPAFQIIAEISRIHGFTSSPSGNGFSTERKIDSAMKAQLRFLGNPIKNSEAGHVVQLRCNARLILPPFFSNEFVYCARRRRDHQRAQLPR